MTAEKNSLLTKREGAKKLRISVRTLEQHLAKNILPHVRLGRRVLIPADALDRWIAGRVSGGAI